jgi:Kef-type K+ transport system membrane component KefB
MSQAGRRLAGSASYGETKYDDYKQCLTKSCQLHLSHECGLTPDIFSFIGHVGVALMIFESGMHFDFDKAKKVGGVACVIAVLGTCLPLIFGTLVIMLLCSKPLFPEGLSAGTALAPTSVGIALKLLNEAQQLQKDHGQIILTAAFVDDILSLVLFNVLFAVGAGEISFMTFLPAIIGIALMSATVVYAATYAAENIQSLLALAPVKPGRKLSPADELLFFLMMITVIVLGTGFFYTGTHLWGCFMAGMCLAKLHVAHHVWVKQTKRVTSWMIRIFFACTVAFSIPIGKLLSFEAFWKGTIMGIGPCIGTKVACAFWMKKTRFVIGWAMVGRAEFAYLIAQLAASSNMMSPEVFSIVIWSLLYATVFAPFLFRTVLARFVKQEAREAAEAAGIPFDEETFNKEHERETDFRQSGHLPDLQELDEDVKREEDEAHAVQQHMSSNAVFKPEKPVFSEAPPADDMHNGYMEKNSYSAAPAPMHDYGSDKEALDATSGAGARGSGFLCCLFFRKIVIM